jgi:hypothetical protein
MQGRARFPHEINHEMRRRLRTLALKPQVRRKPHAAPYPL